MDKPEQPEEITALIQKAEQGDAGAQFKLGLRYDKGLDVEQNDSTAVEWYRKAAIQGNSNAQLLLGIMYEEGRGVKKSDSSAVEWYSKAAEQENVFAQLCLGGMYEKGQGVEKNDTTAFEWYHKAAENGNKDAQRNLGLMYIIGEGVKQDIRAACNWFRKAINQGDSQAAFFLGRLYMKGFDLGFGFGLRQSNARAQALFRKAARNASPSLRFKAIEFQDLTKRHALSPQITKIREDILVQLKSQGKTTMTHYTSLEVGNALLLEKSPFRLGHINALNDPNEGKLLWKYLGYAPTESRPVFVGCFLTEEDSLNMWRFYSKNHKKDDACGCAITFNTENFFNFDLLPTQPSDMIKDEKHQAFINSGKSPQESAEFYRVIYIKGDMQIDGEDSNSILSRLLKKLKREVNKFLGKKPDAEKIQQLSQLLGPLPYLLKDADYEAENEHRIIITHLEYGAKEIQVQEPDLINGTPPRLYLEMHRPNHLAPVKHVTLGPKAPNQEIMSPYWHHQLARKYPEQIKAKPDFYINVSKCAYQ